MLDVNLHLITVKLFLDVQIYCFNNKGTVSEITKDNENFSRKYNTKTKQLQLKII